MQKYLDIYGKSLRHLDVSPFEFLDMLDVRDYLHLKYNELSEHQRYDLEAEDIYLLQNAEEFYQKISTVYDFGNSKDISPEQWWWHLDKWQWLQENFELVLKKRRLVRVYA
ncbi:hypothetical protein [Lysinibacillus sp. TE18511]